jgi:hypothetical protein
VTAWFCCLCGAPARPGSVQPAAADDDRFATGVCSGEHQYGTPDPAQRLTGRTPDGRELTNTRQRRVGMIRDPRPAPPSVRPRPAPSLPLFGVIRDDHR